MKKQRLIIPRLPPLLKRKEIDWNITPSAKEMAEARKAFLLQLSENRARELVVELEKDL